MTTVVIAPTNVLTYPGGGGHFWVYMQYVLGLRALGCDVYWLEALPPPVDRATRDEQVGILQGRVRKFGLDARLLFYEIGTDPVGGFEFVEPSPSDAEAICRRADLLLDFDYATPEAVLQLFRRTALVDIDPGLLQFWMVTGQLEVAQHDVCFTTGETVGQPGSEISGAGLSWTTIRPPVFLPEWPFAKCAAGDAYTTVSGWWGGDGKGEWITDGHGVFFENNKRASFMRFRGLPQLTLRPLELALALGEGDPADSPGEDVHAWVPPSVDRHSVTDYVSDAVDRRALLAEGWCVRNATEVASTPDAYREYIQRSRGEFSCAKPSCMYFQNAWVSDRTICYLASGRPVVVQDTGPSAILPDGLGMFRFETEAEAAAALAAIDADYDRHREAARSIAESLFDSGPILERVLNHAL